VIILLNWVILGYQCALADFRSKFGSVSEFAVTDAFEVGLLFFSQLFSHMSPTRVHLCSATPPDELSCTRSGLDSTRSGRDRAAGIDSLYRGGNGGGHVCCTRLDATVVLIERGGKGREKVHTSC
jgi:hypothetical protein